MRAKYGISVAEYEHLLNEQQGVCAICRTNETHLKKGKFCIDHDHTTGVIRAVLCYACNVGLGAFRDCPITLRAAADYLERHAARAKRTTAA
jgi:hypothetical protein